MPKFTELEKGTMQKNGKEYDYVVEVSDDFPQKKEGNVRLKIIEERPAIRKVRTRYDPEITMYGDKGASMELLMGYNPKEVRNALKYLIYVLIAPFFITAISFGLMYADKIPAKVIPNWTAIPLGIFVIAASVMFFRLYFRGAVCALSGYLKSREVSRLLKERGFKQEEI